MWVMASGVAQPTVSVMPMRWAPLSAAIQLTSRTKPRSDLVVSSVEKENGMPWSRQ